MNKRFKELAKQATKTTTRSGAFGLQQSDSQIDMDKFGELIVNHAVEVVRDVLRDERSDLSYLACEQVQARIREYFGVK